MTRLMMYKAFAHEHMNWINFQYMSDVHTEYMTLDVIEHLQITPVAPYLILAGDIGDPNTPTYKFFLQRMASMFVHVFVISGNHEYWRASNAPLCNHDTWIEHIDDIIKRVTSSFANVTYLQNDTYDIPNSDITLFGGTFWSHVLIEEEEHIRHLKDYKHIPNLSVSQVRAMHRHACHRLHDTLCSSPSRMFIVVSHHMPSYSLVNPVYLARTPSVNSAYASEISLANDPSIIAWVAGHTHTPIQKGKFFLNPIGYQNENTDIDFTKTFSIPCTKT